VLTIDRSARATVTAAPERCLERLADVEAYPSWASLIRSAEVVGQRVRLRAELVGQRVRLRAELLGVAFEMDCELEVAPGRAILRRVPYDARDDERFEAVWAVSPTGSASEVELHVVAALDAPGPARLLRGRVERRLVDDLLGDFAKSL
jgi:ribosome-associated toxin RatA of RatAB toxin-antitoxin module